MQRIKSFKAFTVEGGRTLAAPPSLADDLKSLPRPHSSTFQDPHLKPSKIKMPGSRHNDEHWDVCRIVATTAPPNPAFQDKGLLQHVRLQHSSPLERTTQPSKLALLPGEFLTNISGQRDSQRIYSLAFDTSLGRTLTVGSSHWQGQLIWFNAPMGHELRSLDFMTDRSNGIIGVHPHFVPRKRVSTDYKASWSKALAKLQVNAKKREELPHDAVSRLLASLDDTMHRLSALDDRGIISVAALAASFDDLLQRAIDDVFSRSNVVARALTLGAGTSQRRANLDTVAKQLRGLTAQLKDQFEATERKFLTEASVSDGTDVVPLLLRFLTQPVSRYNCDTAMAVFETHLRTISNFRLDYLSRLMYFFLCEGDLSRLQEVVTLQAQFQNVSNAQVFKSWEFCVPAVRLAIKYRHVAVLHWLLFHVQLYPEDDFPLVQLNADSDDRLWTIDQLLTTREDCEALEKCRQIVARARRAHDFHARTRQLLDTKSIVDPTVVSRVEALVPLMTHAYDLKWLFTFVDLFDLPEAAAKSLFARAFHHVLDQKLVLGEPSAIFFRKALKKAKREGFVTRNDANKLYVLFTRAHVEGADWVRELQHQVRQTMGEIDSAQTRLDTLHETLKRLRQRMAQHELTQQERRCRKQLLSIVASLLPMVSPAFTILEQCMSLCDPLAIVVQLQENEGSSSELDMGRLLSRNDPTGGVRLQQGLAEALGDIRIDADDLVEVLRDAFRKDSEYDEHGPQRDSDEQRPRYDVATRRMRFQDAVRLYMAQRRELEQAAKASFRIRRESPGSTPALAAEEPAATEPTWRWYNMFTGMRGFFRTP